MSRWKLWAVVVFDLLLAALSFPLTINNLRTGSPDYPFPYSLFLLTLSCITPLVVSVAVLVLGKTLLYEQSIGRGVIVSHRALFWLFVLRSASHILLAEFSPNEGIRNLVSFALGFCFFVTGAVALVNVLIVQHQARRDAKAVLLSNITLNKPPNLS